ncbi:MAG: hypothetical protein JW781_07965 [Deltaproteobacteria bacterium]|nr:hypothetical protein [Candidatus Anaeroferrophillacea bacterium]
MAKRLTMALLIAVLLAWTGGVMAAEQGNGLQQAAEDITEAGIVGPGSINVHKAGDIQMSFGATVRIIPTSEDDYDFGLGDKIGTDIFQSHANEGGWVNDSHIRTENKLYFNAMPNDQMWSFYAALEFDGILDNHVVDDRGNNDGGKIDNGSSNSNYGLERLHGTMRLPFAKDLNLRLHAGWDIYQLDVFDGGGLVYGDDNPGFWLTGSWCDTIDFQVGFHKLKENDWQISDLGIGNYDDDRDLYTAAVDYKINKTNHVKFFYAFNNMRNVAANTIQGYLFGDAISAKLDEKQGDVVSGQNGLSSTAYNINPAFVTGGTVVGTDLATGASIVEGGRVNTGGLVAALDGGQAQIDAGRAQIDAARMSLTNNYFYGNDVQADTMSHHLGFYYQGQFGIVKPFFEAVYQFGEADNTGLSQYLDPYTGQYLKEDYDIDAYALAADVAFDLKELVGFKFEPHIGIMYTSGDDDPTDGDLEGYTGVVNAQRFSYHWGGENTIIGDTNLMMGSILYGYLPELYGSGTPVSTGGLQNFAGAGGGRGDNPGLTMVSVGLNMAPKRFIIFRTNLNYFEFNEDFRLPTLDGRIVPIDADYAGTEWDNELTIAFSKNTFIKTQVSFLFPGDVMEDIAEAYSGEETDDVATRLAMELIWNF